MKNFTSTLHNQILDSALFAGLFFVLITVFPVSLFGDDLNTVSNTGTDVISSTAGYETIVTTPSLSVTAGDKVMVIASFTCQSTQSETVARELTFQITDGTNTSTEIIRQMASDKVGDKGIGSLVHVFTIASTGTKTYSLQHKVTTAKNTESSATLVAINLTTSGSYSLNSDFKTITTEVTTTSGTFSAVTGLETGEVFLPVTGGLYVCASIDSYKNNTGASDDKGEWVIQYKKGVNGTWTNTGNSIIRTIANPNDEGIISLVALLEDQPRDGYYFRLAHRVANGSPTLATNNTSLCAVALGYVHTSNGGRSFKTFVDEPSPDPTNNETNFTDAAFKDFTALGTSVFFHSQYGMSATDVSNAPGFRFTSTGGAVSSITQYRAISSSTDAGAGASVGLNTGLTASSSNTANFQHQSTSGVTLTTNSIIFAGIQLTDTPAPGYWLGGDSGNETQWNNTANWADGSVPTSTTNVTIFNKTNDPVIATTLMECNTLNIVSDATVTVNSGQTFNIAGDLVVESGGSFIGTGTVNLTGSVKTKRYVAKDVWHYISSPVSGQAIDATFMANNDVTQPDVNNFPDTYSFYRWDEPANNWIIHNSTDPVFGDGSFVNGRDYAATFATDRYLEFTGTRNTGDITITAYKTASNGREGNNLVGNPFLSPISLSSFVSGNSNIEGTVRFWSEKGGWIYPSDNYAYWNVTGNIGNGTQVPSNQIGVGQGFMVAATSNGVNVNFNQSMRMHANPNFFKESTPPRVKLSIQYANDYYNETLIALMDDATMGFDNAYDGRKILDGANLYLYTLMAEGDEALAIQGIPHPEEDAIVLPLVIEAGISGEFMLRVKDFENFENGATVLLEDKTLDKWYDLSEVQELSLELTAGIHDSRFYLHFKSSLGIGNQIIGQLRSWYYQHQLIVQNPELTDGTIYLFSVGGVKMMESGFSGEPFVSFDVDYPAGCYLVKVICEKGIYTQKVIIQ
nr:hypothetical protein [Bacteroidota bacterium]